MEFLTINVKKFLAKKNVVVHNHPENHCKDLEGGHGLDGDAADFLHGDSGGHDGAGGVAHLKEVVPVFHPLGQLALLERFAGDLAQGVECGGGLEGERAGVAGARHMWRARCWRASMTS